MLKYPCVAAFFAVIVATGDFSRANDAATVKIMTFNIRYNNRRDGADRWPARHDMAVALIRAQEVDFVGIQEALPDQTADLQKMLPEFHQFGRSREADATRGEAVPILYRHARWRIDKDEHGWFWLSDTPEKPGSNTWGGGSIRIVTWARFVDRKTDRGLYVFNTHLDNSSAAARQKGAMLLAKRIAERKRQEPVVVTGDFNAGEESAVVKIMTGRSPDSPVKLVDTFRALHAEAREVGTFHNFRGGVGGAKIDYIFATPGGKILAAEILRAHRKGRYPSDHYPVTAKIAFPVEGK